MKKIVFMSSHLKIGGMEKALVNLLNRLAEKYEVTLILEKCEGELLNELSKNVKVYEFSLSGIKFPPLRKAVNLLKRTIWSIFNKNKYDFSCSYSTYSPLCAKLALIASKNNALYVHSNYCNVFKDKKKVEDFFSSVELKRFKNSIFVSNESRNDLIKVLPEIENSSFVVNNLIDGNNLIDLSNCADEISFSANTKNLLFLGRLDNSSKNFHLLVKTIKEINDESVKLLVVGDGPDKQMLESLIKENNLESKIFLLGKRTNPYPLLKSCDGIILTSFYEGFPVVYLESLVLGKKIFTTVPTSDEIIDIRDNAVILTYNPTENAKLILNELNSNSAQNEFDFSEYNKKTLDKIYSIIGV